MYTFAKQAQTLAGSDQSSPFSDLFRKAVAIAMIPVMVLTTACGGGDLDGSTDSSVHQAEGLESVADAVERLSAAPVQLPAADEARMLADIEAEDRRIAELKASMTPEQWQEAERAGEVSLSQSSLVDGSPSDRMSALRLTTNSSGGCTANHAKTIPMTMNFSRLAYRVATTSGLGNFLYSPSYRGTRLTISGSIAANSTNRTMYAWHHVSTTCAALNQFTGGSNGWSVWSAKLVSVAAALTVAVLGYGTTVAFAPAFLPYVAPVVGCFSGATASIVYASLRGFSGVKDDAISAGASCIQGAALVGLGVGARALASGVSAAIPAGESIATSWISMQVRSLTGPAVRAVAARVPAAG